MSNYPPDSFSREALDAFLKSRLDLRPELADVIIERDGPEWVCTLRPKREGAASIGIRFQEGSEILYVSFGLHANLEVPVSGRRYTSEEGLAELEVLCRSVISGRFREAALSGSKGRALCTRSELRTASDTVVVKDFDATAILQRRWAKEVRNYSKWHEQ